MKEEIWWTSQSAPVYNPYNVKDKIQPTLKARFLYKSRFLADFEGYGYQHGRASKNGYPF